MRAERTPRSAVWVVSYRLATHPGIRINVLFWDYGEAEHAYAHIHTMRRTRAMPLTGIRIYWRG